MPVLQSIDLQFVAAVTEELPPLLTTGLLDCQDGPDGSRIAAGAGRPEQESIAPGEQQHQIGVLAL